jgi:hypothetical protein
LVISKDVIFFSKMTSLCSVFYKIILVLVYFA